MKRQKEVVSTLETLEEIWDEYQVYSRDVSPVESEFSSRRKGMNQKRRMKNQAELMETEPQLPTAEWRVL